MSLTKVSFAMIQGDPINVLDYGAIGDGLTDDTTAIQSALVYGASSGRTVYFPDGIYRANTLTANCSVTMSESAVIKYNGIDNGYAINLNLSNGDYGVIRVDGNGKNVTPVNLTGSNNSVQKIIVNNVTATIAGDLSFVGVRLTGNNNNIDFIEVSDFSNSGHPNVSFPQAILAFGANNNISNINLRNVRSGLVCSTNEITNVGSIVAYNLTDNGIYQLDGILNVDSLNYYGIEEPAVFLGTATINNLTVTGAALGVGFQDCGDVTINHLHVNEDLAGNSPLFLFRIRSASTNCGRISFNSITGKFKGTTLFLANVGTAKFLTVNNMNVQFMYDAAVATNLSSWANITSFAGFRIANGYVEITDIANVLSGQTFNMTVNAAITKSSFLHDLDVQLYESNGTTEANASFRGFNFAQELIETRGIQWRTDIGPYVVGSTLISGIDDTANAIPTAGSWKRGKRLNQAFPASGGTEGWVCVLSGTPGTWKTFGIIS